MIWLTRASPIAWGFGGGVPELPPPQLTISSPQTSKKSAENVILLMFSITNHEFAYPARIQDDPNTIRSAVAKPWKFMLREISTGLSVLSLRTRFPQS